MNLIYLYYILSTIIFIISNNVFFSNLFFIINILIYISFRINFNRTENESFLMPDIIFVVLYLLYVEGFIFSNFNIYIYKDSLLSYFLFLNYIGFLFFIFGFNLLFKKKEVINNLNVTKFQYKKIWLSSLLFLPIGLFSYLSEIISYGGLMRYISVGYGGQRIILNNSILSTSFGGGVHWLFIPIVNILLSIKKPLIKNILKFSLFVIIFLLFFTGQRGHIIYLVIYYILMKELLSKKKFKIKNFKLFIIIIILLFILLLMSKVYVLIRPLIGNSTLSEIYHHISNIAKSNPEYIFNIFQGDEFSKPAGSLYELLYYKDFHYYFGTTYLFSLLKTIPILGSNISFTNLAAQRMLDYYPTYYRRGLGFGYFINAEAYINLDIMGIIIVMFILGMIISHLYKKRKDNIYYSLIYAGSFYYLVINSLRYDTSWFWQLSRRGLLTFVLYILISFLIRVKSNYEKKY